MLQGLANLDWEQELRWSRRVHGVAPDGRRKFGSVRDAILAVLEEAGSELRVRDIHARVEEPLGESVGSSVRDYLHKGCRRSSPLFQYFGKRGYRVIQRDEPMDESR
jgi:hypothetical protein